MKCVKFENRSLNLYGQNCGREFLPAFQLGI